MNTSNLHNRFAANLKSKIQNLKSRRLRRRRGVILLLVVSLLALFVLMGVTFSLVALQSLNASKLDLKISQVGDGPDTEMDIVLGQILYDTQSRTVLQYHSLLRDLYGYDDGQVPNPSASGPQFRESIGGATPANQCVVVDSTRQQPLGVTFPVATGPSNGRQFYTFTFALPWFPPTNNNNPPTFANAQHLPMVGGSFIVPNTFTALSQISNYYAGRVVTFTSGAAANHSARIVSYYPTSFYQHQNVGPNNATFTDGSTSYYYPAYGQITIEAIESKLAGSLVPGAGDTFVMNGAPFNGAGAGYDYLTNNIDAMLINNNAPTSSYPNLGEYVALLPNYASYDANNTSVLFNALDNVSGMTPRRAANAIGFGGFDESWDVPDFQNMFLAMVPPKTAQYQYSSPMPIIPSFHRPELINYWVNYIQKILGNLGLPSMSGSPTLQECQGILSILAYPYGPDRQRGTADDPITIGGVSIPLAQLDRIYNIMHGCILRPMPWDHPNFTGSNPNMPTMNAQSPQFDSNNQFTLLTNIINSPTNLNQTLLTGATNPPSNRAIWDVDNDSDGVPDSIWIDPGLPVITSPDGRRYKRLAAILVKDLDGLINVNAHGNLQQIYNYTDGNGNVIYPYLANTPMQTSMMRNGYAAPLLPSGYNYAYTVGMASSQGAVGQQFPRGLGFGPAEVQFSNLLGNDPGAYSNMLFSRYVSQRVTFPLMGPNGAVLGFTVPDTLTLDSGSNAIYTTGLPFARPGLPYSRDALALIKHNGVPNDHSNNNGLSPSVRPLQPSWYASPPDVWGRGAVLLDVSGQPLMTFMGQANEMLDSPYEMSLSGEENGTDSPYTVAELEVLYRYHDSDASQLSRRLLLAGYSSTSNTNFLSTEPQGSIGLSHARRNSLTTLSSHIPAPAMRAPQEVRVSSTLGPYLPMMGSASILDLYRAKLLAGGVTLLNLPTAMNQIVPWEFFKGQKFDLNRWLGDGVDNDGNGSRDDASEAYAALINPFASPPRTTELAFRGDDFNADGSPDMGGSGVMVPNMSLPRSFVNISPAYTNGFTTFSDGYAARQLYARHLFCLAMLLMPDDPSGGGLKFGPDQSTYDSDANLSPNLSTGLTNARTLMVRRIAQWAVNCVDFRDSDSAMTPFEFDYNPWDGWSVDGFVGMTPGPDGKWGKARVDDDGNGIIDDRIEAGASGSDDVLSSDDSNGLRGLVWGMEGPDLLITETLAFHDRGVKDTNQDNNSDGQSGTYVDPSRNPMGAMADNDLDQFRIPKGSVFVELYSPRGKTWPGETENYKTPSRYLNLAGAGPDGRPVWRLAFGKLKNVVDPTNLNPATLALTNPETMFPETVYQNPSGPGWLSNLSPIDSSKQLRIDRFAYFVDASGALPPTDVNASFFNANVTMGGTMPLYPGQYALVGPRTLTYLGSQNPTSVNPPPPAGSLWGGNSQQYIQLNPNANLVAPPPNTSSLAYEFATPSQESVVVKNTSGGNHSRSATSTTYTDMRQPQAIICDMPNPSVAWRQGLNLSEPLASSGNYYPATNLYSPSDSSTTTLTAGPGARATNGDFYDNPDAPTKLFLDTPLEEKGLTTYPISREIMQQAATYLDCSSVLLQRLADATLPYNPPAPDLLNNPSLPINPYITVDWATLDLTVMSGEESLISSASPNPFVGQPIYDGSGKPLNTYYFRSRQRGFLAVNGTGLTLTSNPWPPITLNMWINSLMPQSSTYFNLDLFNLGIGKTPATNNFTNPQFPYSFDTANDRQTLGSLNSTLDFPNVNRQINNAVTPYFGEPFIPFPWLSWNNRPFSNAMELLCVPSSAPSRVALEMTPDYPFLPGGSAPPAITSPYVELPTVVPGIIPYRLHWPFGHLLNLFQSSQINTQPTYSMGSPPTFPNAQTTAIQAPHFSRIFDYVEVPSPFAGAERWYNPTNFVTTAANPTGTPPYNAPFNKLSRFRDPGRINFNTIFDDPTDTVSGDGIWDAAVAQFPGLRTIDTFFRQMALSRQGDGGTVNLMNPAFPTRFANPFRSSDSADLMPPVGSPPMRTGVPAFATLLRPDPTTLLALNPQPLFQINNATAAGNWMAVQYDARTYPSRAAIPDPPGYPANAHDTKRNPYFRYQPLQKLGAIAAQNSNCFAVWITIGYFEVEENRPTAGTLAGQIMFDAAHPDGFCLGQEIGIDTGEVTRHRGFFIIDRSIPVGFVPGSRLNTDDCILVRRLIE